MAVSRSIDITELEQTRINLVNICFHLLGLSKEEKTKYFEKVYRSIFNNKLSWTLRGEIKKNPKYKALDNQEAIDQIASELKGCIIRIPNNEISNILEVIIKEYASRHEAAAVIHDLNQQREKISHTDASLQKKSEDVWGKIFKKLEHHVSLKEKATLLLHNDYLQKFILMCVLALLTMPVLFYMMFCNYNDNEATMMFYMQIGLAFIMTTSILKKRDEIKNNILYHLLYSNHNKVKYNSEQIDKALIDPVNKVIGAYYAKKHAEMEALQARLAALHEEVMIDVAPELDSENEASDTEQDSEEEKPHPEKREKIKRRPAFSTPKPVAEVKQNNSRIDTLCLDTVDLKHRYERIGNPAAGLFFNVDPQKLNRLITGSSEVFNKVEAAILTRRYNKPHAKKLGVTELSTSELSQEESGSTHKVRIKGKPRLFVELRDPTPEEHEQSRGAIKRVLSPRRYAPKH